MSSTLWENPILFIHSLPSHVLLEVLTDKLWPYSPMYPATNSTVPAAAAAAAVAVAAEGACSRNTH